MIGIYFIQDKYRYTFSSNNKEKELNIINQENESLLTKKKNDTDTTNITKVNIKIIYKKILNYIFLSCVILYKL
jgi:hypothetical protein